jgi:hypothetical protein
MAISVLPTPAVSLAVDEQRWARAAGLGEGAIRYVKLHGATAS